MCISINKFLELIVLLGSKFLFEQLNVASFARVRLPRDVCDAVRVVQLASAKYLWSLSESTKLQMTKVKDLILNSLSSLD